LSKPLPAVPVIPPTAPETPEVAVDVVLLRPDEIVDTPRFVVRVTALEAMPMAD